MASTSVFRSRVLGGPFQLLRAASRSSLIALVVALAAVVSGVLTYLTITGLAPYNPTPATMVVLIVVDLSLVLALAGLIGWRATRLCRRAAGAAVDRAPERRRRVQAAFAAGRDVLRHRGDAGDPGGDLRRGVAEPRHRGLVLRA